MLKPSLHWNICINNSHTVVRWLWHFTCLKKKKEKKNDRNSYILIFTILYCFLYSSDIITNWHPANSCCEAGLQTLISLFAMLSVAKRSKGHDAFVAWHFSESTQLATGKNRQIKQQLKTMYVLIFWSQPFLLCLALLCPFFSYFWELCLTGYKPYDLHQFVPSEAVSTRVQLIINHCFLVW